MRAGAAKAAVFAIVHTIKRGQNGDVPRKTIRLIVHLRCLLSAPAIAFSATGAITS